MDVKEGPCLTTSWNLNISPCSTAFGYIYILKTKSAFNPKATTKRGREKQTLEILKVLFVSV